MSDNARQDRNDREFFLLKLGEFEGTLIAFKRTYEADRKCDMESRALSHDKNVLS